MSDEPATDADGTRRRRGDGGARDAFEARDSLEVEVTRLRPSSRSVSPTQSVPGTAPASRRGARQRTRTLLGGALAVGVLAGLLIALLARMPRPASPAHATIAPTPTPTETLALGADTITLGYAVPWGTLHIDGKLTGIPAGAPLTLTRGRHKLVYAAAPFDPVSCVLSVPAAPSLDTCPLVPGPNANPASQNRTLNMGDVPDKLPQAQLQSLDQLASQTLAHTSAGIPISPGDHYVGASGQMHSATTAFTAEQVLAADDTNLGTKQPDQSLCFAICTAPTPSPGTDPSTTPRSGTTGTGWQLSVRMTIHWRYVAADGSVIADQVVPAMMGNPSLEYYTPLAVTWDDSRQAWQLTDARQAAYVPGTAPSCTFMDSAFAAVAPGNITGGGLPKRNVIPSPQAYDEGCALAVHTVPSSANGPYQLDDALYLYRCGAFIAANAAAHRLTPQVPVASAHEAALTSDWAAKANEAGDYGIPTRY